MTHRKLALGATIVLVAAGALTVMHTAAAAKDSAADKALRHVVLFKFKDGTTDDQVAEVVDAFRDLKTKIDVIEDFEYGTDVSVENRSEGFTHCFFVTFADEQARDSYLPHPAHKAFGALVGPRLDKVLVVDYWVKK